MLFILLLILNAPSSSDFGILFQNLDIAVVKATSHFKVLPKEKHVRSEFENP